MPSLLIDIGANIARLQQDVAQAQKSIQGFAKSTESAFASINAMAGVVGLGLSMAAAATAFMDAERAAMKMAVAMKNQGDYSKAAMQDMEAFSKVIQKTTSYEDDATLAVMANMKTYGMTNEEVKKATKAVLDLATAKQDEGVTTERASEVIGKAYLGQTTALKKMGIVIDENIPAAQKYDAVIKQLNERFGGASTAELDTYAGQWKQIKNEFQDIAEIVGHGLIKALEAGAYAANMVAAGFYTVLEAGSKFTAWAADKVGLDSLAEWQKKASEEFETFKNNAISSADVTLTMLQNMEGGIDKAMAKMKTGKRTVPVFTDDKDNKAWAEQINEMIKAYGLWDKEVTKIGQSETASELAELQKRYEYFSKYIDDKVKLEEWFAQMQRDIQLRASNEQLAIYEKLYADTGNQKYLQKSLDLVKQIMDAEEQKWKTILNDDDAAYEYRIGKEKEYVDRVKSGYKEIVKAAQETNLERFTRNYPMGGSSEDASSLAGSITSSKSTSSGTYDTVYGRVFIDDRSGAQSYASQIESTLKAARDAATSAAQAAANSAQALAEQAAAEAKRAAEERQNSFNASFGKYTSYMQERTRSSWGQSEYQGEYSRLVSQFNNSQYYETSLSTLDEMLDVLKTIEGLNEQAIEANKQLAADMTASSKSIQDWLAELMTGNLAPVQSAAGYASQFESARALAMTGEGLDAFLSSAQKYLEFEKSFGTSGSYSSAYKSVTDAVKAVQEQYDLYAGLANLGLGQSIDDLNLLIDAFTDLGVPMKALKDAAADAAGTQGMGKIIEKLVGEGYTNLPDASINASKAVGDLAANTQTQLLAVAAYWDTLATKMGLNMNAQTAGSIIGSMQPPVTQTTTYTQPKYNQYTVSEGFYTAPGGQRINPAYQPVPPGAVWTPAGTYFDYAHPNYARGGLSSGPSIFGEKGPEWAVPTYEPERSAFLKNVGADPESIGRAVARAIGGGGGDITVSIQIDGREIGYAVAKQTKTNRDLQNAIRGLNS